MPDADKEGIRKVVQAMDAKTLHAWKSEVMGAVWARGLSRGRNFGLIRTELLSDGYLRYRGFSDESIRLIRLAEKVRKESR